MTQQASAAGGPYTYYAFISYKREDAQWAKWLQHKLQTYRLPAKLCKQHKNLPKRLTPVFMDATNLLPGALEHELRREAAQSKYMIVVCSEHTCRAPEYIDKEISYFLESGHAPTQIIPFIVGASPAPEQDCFPPALKALNARATLLGVNIRENGRRTAFLKVVAAILGLKLEAVESAEKRRVRRNRRMTALCALAAAAAVAITGVGHYDYFVPKLAYYADYTTRLGVPVGLFERTKAQTGQMNAHYVIEICKGKVRALRHENAYGQLAAHIDSETTERPAAASYSYREDGTLETVTYTDAHGSVVLTMN